MPISMEKFASHGALARYDPFDRRPSERRVQLQIQCRVCNYEPDVEQPLMKVCPKCHASAWEWFVRRQNVEPSERAGHRSRFRRPMFAA